MAYIGYSIANAIHLYKWRVVVQSMQVRQSCIRVDSHTMGCITTKPCARQVVQSTCMHTRTQPFAICSQAKGRVSVGIAFAEHVRLTVA